MTNDQTYNPVRFNPEAIAIERCANDPEFKIAYDALEDEFATLAALLDARTQAGLTQAEVAFRMGVSQPVQPFVSTFQVYKFSNVQLKQ